MERLLAFAIAVACGFTVGCGKPTCETLRASLDALDEKALPCGDATASSSSAQFDTGRCQSAQERCAPEDRERLAEFARCLDGLPTCDPVSKAAWERQAVACAMVAQGLSAGCSAALGGN